MAILVPIAFVVFSIVINVYTVYRHRKQKRIEAGHLTTGTIQNKSVHYDPRGWAKGFIDYTFEAPAPEGGTKTYRNRRQIRNGLLDSPKPGDRLEVRYVPEDPTVSNIEDNGAQMMGWWFASALLDGILIWAIYMIVAGMQENA